MEPAIPYVACVLGAIALYLLLRPGTRALKASAAILGLGALAWLLVIAGRRFGASEPPETFFVIFSLIAIASAVRMITHHRPVYSALYFIMVVLSSAALFLLLQAEFMAFALVIVYAGAILITYMFVLMLAQQATSADQPDSQPEYDLTPREPAAAALVGFIMLALFTHMIFGAANRLPLPNPDVVQAKSSALSELMNLPPGAEPNNVQMVGLDLVWKFPVSLELAGVILLMAMFGAVVLARKQIELGEDEVREAAGMRRLDLHGEHPIEPMSSDGGRASTRPGTSGGQP